MTAAASEAKQTRQFRLCSIPDFEDDLKKPHHTVGPRRAMTLQSLVSRTSLSASSFDASFDLDDFFRNDECQCDVSASGLEVAVIQPARAKIGTTTNKKKSRPKRNISHSTDQAISGSLPPPRNRPQSETTSKPSDMISNLKRKNGKQPLVLSSSPCITNAQAVPSTNQSEGKLHSSSPSLESSKDGKLSLPLTSGRDSDRSIVHKTKTPSTPIRGNHKASEIPLLKGSKRDLDVKTERGRALASRLLQVAEDLTILEESTKNLKESCLESQAVSNDDIDCHRRRPRRYSLDSTSPKSRRNVAGTRRPGSRSPPRTPRGRRSPVVAQAAVLLPGEKLFVPDERNTRTKRSDNPPDVKACNDGSNRSDPPPKRTARLLAGNEHQAERRRRQRNSTGHDMLKQVLANISSVEAERDLQKKKEALKKKEMARLVLSPDQKTKVAPWEKRFAARMLLRQDTDGGPIPVLPPCL